MQGEVAAVAVEAYSRAGKSVYELIEDVESRRLAAVIEEKDAPPVPVQAAQLCAWNAFTLQVLGDELLAADYRCEPRTVGYVEPMIAKQALDFFGQVPGWLSRAQQALHNQFYELDVEIPAELPPWVVQKRCTEAYLEGLLSALRRLRAFAEVAAWESRSGDPADAKAAGRVAQHVAAAASAADYAMGLFGESPESDLIEPVLAQTQLALQRYYLVGQIVAMPDLLADATPKPAMTRHRPPDKLIPPGYQGFDRWCLSDPRRVALFKRIPAARRAVDALWASDMDPERTLAIRAEINAALYRDDISYADGHYYECPWSAVYTVKRRVRIAKTTLHPLQHFTYDVGLTLPGHGTFVRRLLVGTFFPTGGEGWSR